MEIWNKLVAFKGTPEQEHVKSMYLRQLNTSGGRTVTQEAERWLAEQTNCTRKRK